MRRGSCPVWWCHGAGRLRRPETCSPYRLVDEDGAVVGSAVAFFAELMACGRPGTTQRSYGMDLLRWFRFLWSVGIGWDEATRAEARDFCRWLQVAGKPVAPHWRYPAGGAPGVRLSLIHISEPTR